VSLMCPFLRSKRGVDVAQPPPGVPIGYCRVTWSTIGGIGQSSESAIARSSSNSRTVTFSSASTHAAQASSADFFTNGGVPARTSRAEDHADGRIQKVDSPGFVQALLGAGSVAVVRLRQYEYAVVVSIVGSTCPGAHKARFVAPLDHDSEHFAEHERVQDQNRVCQDRFLEVLPDHGEEVYVRRCGNASVGPH